MGAFGVSKCFAKPIDPGKIVKALRELKRQVLEPDLSAPKVVDWCT